jgi:hypothetical protein
MVFPIFLSNENYFYLHDIIQGLIKGNLKDAFLNEVNNLILSYEFPSHI